MSFDPSEVLTVYLGAGEAGGYQPIGRDERLRAAYPQDFQAALAAIEKYLNFADYPPGWLAGGRMDGSNADDCECHGRRPMKRKHARSLAWLLILSTALAGCSARIRTTEYPVAWPARAEKAGNAECIDISGSYRAGSGDSLLPFFLFGINETSSQEWSDLVRVNEQVLAAPDDSTVTVGFPDADRMEVVVAVRGTPVARQVLKRSDLSASTAEMWPGQGDRTFRCDPDSIVTVGASVSDWTRFRLPYEERKRLYKRRDIRHAGTSHGYFDFTKAVDGSLVMRERRFFCVDCGNLDHRWRRWDPVLGPRRASR